MLCIALHYYIFSFKFLQGVLRSNIVFDTERRSSLFILGRNSVLDRLKTCLCNVLNIHDLTDILKHIELFARLDIMYACNEWVSK